jgi:hypothetical protein
VLQVYEQFDNVMLMREGRIVYHGPRTMVLRYFSDMGLQCPDDTDTCGTWGGARPRSLHETPATLGPAGIPGGAWVPCHRRQLLRKCTGDIAGCSTEWARGAAERLHQC